MPSVISVENLSKSYRLGQIGTGTLTRDLEVWWARMRGKPNPLLKIGQEDHGNRDGETLWALKDVSFQVEQGEVLGIIGRNGAGKSTLLKILSRVTAPTSGQIKVKGRIASLLEVGTGFHPELTGRENIYLNGAILGMTRQEITRKLDEIVAFAEVEQFLDTPVKRYSSGMYVRLAFAVAAHLESEILLVDEVLAVGDAEFQKKCLGKMGDVASKEGRTVLFVSHNMAAVQQLCPNGIMLQNGLLVLRDTAVEVISKYLSIFKNDSGNNPYDIANTNRTGSKSIFLTNGKILDEQGNVTTSLIAGNKATFVFDYANPNRVNNVNISLTVFNSSGLAVTNMSTSLVEGDIVGLGRTGQFQCTIDRLPFPIGEYRVAIAIHDNGRVSDLIPDALFFTIDSSAFFPSFRIPDRRYSVVLVDHHWSQTTWSSEERRISR